MLEFGFLKKRAITNSKLLRNKGSGDNGRVDEGGYLPPGYSTLHFRASEFLSITVHDVENSRNFP